MSISAVRLRPMTLKVKFKDKYLQEKQSEATQILEIKEGKIIDSLLEKEIEID